MAGKPEPKPGRSQKGTERVHYQWFQLWLPDEGVGRSIVKGRAHVDLIRRKSLVCNFHFAIYSKGFYPHYRKNNVAKDDDGNRLEGTVQIPLPVLFDLVAEITEAEVRVRKTDAHKWRKYHFVDGKKVDS